MAKKLVYEMQFSYEAPDLLKSEQAGKEITELFEDGEMVIGEPYRKDNIIVEERYIIPIDYVKQTNKFPYLKKDSKFDETISRVKAQAVKISEKDSDKLDSVGDNIKEIVEGKTKKRLNQEAKSYKNGALLGLGAGILTALYLKKNIWVFGLLGVALGGYVANRLNKAKQGNNKVEPITTTYNE